MYFTTGFAKGQLVAIKPPEADAWGGCVTDIASTDTPTPKKPQVVWSFRKAVANKPSLLLVGELIFMLSDGGVVTCIDAKSGTEIWSQRIGGSNSGDYSGSPLHANGRIYFANQQGKFVVIEAGKEFKVLAENVLPEGSYASPAAAGNALFLRTKTALYRIEN
jgi:outer membrane protein assembly factor BamB